MARRNLLRRIAAGLFIVSLPLLFGTLSLRWLVSDVGWFRAEYAKYGVPQTTGVSLDELTRATGEMSRYLLLQRDNLDIPVRIGSQTVPLFNEREIKHMVDVQNLLGAFYNLLTASAGFILFYLVASRYWSPGNFWASLGRKLRWGGGLTLGLFGLFGVASMLDFDQLFLEFHLLSFDNDLWILDPTKDRLIMMVPQGFFYDSAIRLALASAAQAGLAIVAGTVLARRFSADGRRQSAAGSGRV